MTKKKTTAEKKNTFQVGDIVKPNFQYAINGVYKKYKDSDDEYAVVQYVATIDKTYVVQHVSANGIIGKLVSEDWAYFVPFSFEQISLVSPSVQKIPDNTKKEYTALDLQKAVLSSCNEVRCEGQSALDARCVQKMNDEKAKGFFGGIGTATSLGLIAFSFVLPVTIISVYYWTGAPVFIIAALVLVASIYFGLKKVS